MATEIRLPELGENIDSGLVAKVLVSAGDRLTREQSVLELETDKAVIEVPSPLSGTVLQVHMKQGEEVKVGQLILTLDAETGVESKAESAPLREKGEEKSWPSGGRPVTGRLVREEGTQAEVVDFTQAPRVTPPPEILPATPPASPSVRRLARELGVDIDMVSGSGPGGRIMPEDVRTQSSPTTRSRGRSRSEGAVPGPPLPDFSQWGEVEREPMSMVRRKTAESMAQAWSTIPHVTQFDKADITGLERLRKRFAGQATAAGGKLTVTAILLKVCASALKIFPQFNASLDMLNNQIIYKKYYHLGVAVETDRGLIVPVIREVDKKNILELSVELTRVAEKARDKKLSLEEMQGGTFTLTNLGGIGGANFSPIVYAPQVAILGISRARVEPTFVNEQFEPRLMLPLSLSYDHRVIDGAEAARFLRWVAEALQHPFLLALEG